MKNLTTSRRSPAPDSDRTRCRGWHMRAAFALATALFVHTAPAAVLDTNVILKTTGQSMWGTGDALQLDIQRELMSVQWGNSRTDPLSFKVGDIIEARTPAATIPNPAYGLWKLRNAACFVVLKKRICPLGNPGNKPAKTLKVASVDLGDYGAEIEGSTYGDIGLEFRASADSGSVDVELPVNVKLELPDSDELKAGDTFTVSSSVDIDQAALMRTAFPDVEAGLFLTYDIFAEATGTACLKNCAGPGKILPTIDLQGEVEIIGIDPTDGLSSGFEFELEKEDDDNNKKKKQDVSLGIAGDISVKLPDIETVGRLENGTLKSSGEDDLLALSLDVDELARTAAGIPVPFGADGIEFLGGEVAYDILDVRVGATIATTQEFAYDPKVMVALDTGFGSPVIFEAGTSVDITIPDDATSVSLNPTYFIADNAAFRNTTGIRVDPTSSVKALELSFGIDLPSAVNVLGFDDPSFNVGPLFEDSFRLEGPGVPLFDQTFALEGFNEVSTTGLTLSLTGASRDFVAELVTGSEVGISQTVANPGTLFSLGFDYLFESGVGTLDVMLGEHLLTSLDGTTQFGFARFDMDFDLNGLLNAGDLADYLATGFLDLQFLFDGPTGSTLLLDDITFTGVSNGDFASADLSGWTALLPNGAGTVGTTAQLATQAPEPGSIALLGLGLLAFAGFSRRRRRA